MDNTLRSLHRDRFKKIAETVTNKLGREVYYMASKSTEEFVLFEFEGESVGCKMPSEAPEHKIIDHLYNFAIKDTKEKLRLAKESMQKEEQQAKDKAIVEKGMTELNVGLARELANEITQVTGVNVFSVDGNATADVLSFGVYDTSGLLKTFTYNIESKTMPEALKTNMIHEVRILKHQCRVDEFSKIEKSDSSLLYFKGKKSQSESFVDGNPEEPLYSNHMKKLYHRVYIITYDGALENNVEYLFEIKGKRYHLTPKVRVRDKGQYVVVDREPLPQYLTTEL